MAPTDHEGHNLRTPPGKRSEDAYACNHEGAKKSKHAAHHADNGAAAASPVTFATLSDELLIMVFQYTDYFIQRQRRRVDKRWNRLLSSPEVAETIILNSDSKSWQSVSYGPLVEYIYSPHKSSPVVDSLSDIKNIIFIGGTKPGDWAGDDDDPYGRGWRTFYEFSTCCRALQHTVLLKCDSKMVQYGVTWYGSSVPKDLDRAKPRITYIQCEGSIPLEPLVEGDCVLVYKIPHVQWDDESEFDGVTETLFWPYGDDQLVWLKDTVKKLEKDKKWSEAMANLKKDQSEVYKATFGFLEATSNHGKNKHGGISGKALLLMAGYILARSEHDIKVARPPEKFDFETGSFYERAKDLDFSDE